MGKAVTECVAQAGRTQATHVRINEACCAEASLAAPAAVRAVATHLTPLQLQPHRQHAWPLPFPAPGVCTPLAGRPERRTSSCPPSCRRPSRSTAVSVQARHTMTAVENVTARWSRRGTAGGKEVADVPRCHCLPSGRSWCTGSRRPSRQARRPFGWRAPQASRVLTRSLPPYGSLGA